MKGFFLLCCLASAVLSVGLSQGTPTSPDAGVEVGKQTLGKVPTGKMAKEAAAKPSENERAKAAIGKRNGDVPAPPKKGKGSKPAAVKSANSKKVQEQKPAAAAAAAAPPQGKEEESKGRKATARDYISVEMDISMDPLTERGKTMVQPKQKMRAWFDFVVGRVRYESGAYLNIMLPDRQFMRGMEELLPAAQRHQVNEAGKKGQCVLRDATNELKGMKIMWERPASLFVGVRKCDEDTLEECYVWDTDADPSIAKSQKKSPMGPSRDIFYEKIASRLPHKKIVVTRDLRSVTRFSNIGVEKPLNELFEVPADVPCTPMAPPPPPAADPRVPPKHPQQMTQQQYQQMSQQQQHQYQQQQQQYAAYQAQHAAYQKQQQEQAKRYQQQQQQQYQQKKGKAPPAIEEEYHDEDDTEHHEDEEHHDDEDEAHRMAKQIYEEATMDEHHPLAGEEEHHEDEEHHEEDPDVHDDEEEDDDHYSDRKRAPKRKVRAPKRKPAPKKKKKRVQFKGKGRAVYNDDEEDEDDDDDDDDDDEEHESRYKAQKKRQSTRATKKYDSKKKEKARKKVLEDAYEYLHSDL